MDSPRYIMVKIAESGELVIYADLLKTNALATFVTTEPMRLALSAASQHGGGIVYFPAGIYPIGNFIIPSTISLYPAPGSTGERIHCSSTELNVFALYNTHDIKIYGCGTMDTYGDYARKVGKFIARAVVPLNATSSAFDEEVLIIRAKIFNHMDLGENDAIDIQQSQQSSDIALDDSFSTKAWPVCKGVMVSYPGRAVTFLNGLARIHCNGFKVGQIWEEQRNIRFESRTVYNAAVARVENKGEVELIESVSMWNVAIRARGV
ncbi:hypothetical protein BDQ12DRAFT_737929 [Crucibulum laeve]|uniref:Pectate lyase superfamily protein domain-containing protein n=1 Tax=Crucibulum laeve TaxID=68775 RepID=A0A5C3LPZ6_9AGAR|nr:hypothetical protein BDQ12DRAFT_737929 [Crucibulum laeve]